MSPHRQQRALDKKRRLRRLRKKARRESFVPAGTTLVYDPPGMAKMSEVLWDFVDPYLESAATEDALRKLLTVASVAWNAALLPPAEREEMIRKSGAVLPADMREDYQAILEPLIARKQGHFAGNQRAIVSFELTMEPAGPYLQVMSTLDA